MAVFVANETGAPVDEGELAALARFVLTELGVHPLVELSIMLVDVGHMTELHEKHLGEPGPTDVLAFPMDDLVGTRKDDDDRAAPPTLLGDVILCPEVAERQARSAEHSTADELHLLCTHGVLHLLGYDHAEPGEEQEMFDLQSRLLVAWQAARGRR